MVVYLVMEQIGGGTLRKSDDIKASVLCIIVLLPSILILTSRAMYLWQLIGVICLFLHPLSMLAFKIPIRNAIRISFTVGFLLGIFSIATGIFNGLTDVPFAFPLEQQILFQGRNPYNSYELVYWNRDLHVSHFWELPLSLVFVPPIGGYIAFEIFMFICWCVTIYILRNHIAGIMMSAPYVALLSANGFSDFLPILLLTISFVGINGRHYRIAEVISLGVKQFACVIVAIRYIFIRDYKNFIMTCLIILGWCLPFLIWDWHSFICQAVIFENHSSCVSSYFLGRENPAFLQIGGISITVNYMLYSLWLIGVYYKKILNLQMIRKLFVWFGGKP